MSSRISFTVKGSLVAGFSGGFAALILSGFELPGWSLSVSDGALFWRWRSGWRVVCPLFHRGLFGFLV